MAETIAAVKEKYPTAYCKMEGYNRYGIYQRYEMRIEGASCLSIYNAWRSALNKIKKPTTP